MTILSTDRLESGPAPGTALGPVLGLSPALGYAWRVTALLTLVQVVSYIDRYLPSLMLEPIKRSLALDDFQISLMLGPAFGLFYVTMGLPLGWLGDRARRRTLLAVGIAVWCTMTALASLATSFPMLLLARLGVGLGEAAVAPAALSMIADMFPRTIRARAVGVFMSGTYIGAGTAFLVGGPIVQAIAGWPQAELLGHAFQPWQLTFLVVGVPGLLLALAMLGIREPPRTEAVETLGARPSLAAAAGYIAQRWRPFGTLFLGSACSTLLGSLAFWNAALYQRSYGWGVRDVGIATGLLFFSASPLGTWFAVRIMDRGLRRGVKDVTVSTLLLGLAIGGPAFALYPLMPTAPLAIAMMGVAYVGQAIATVAGPATLALLAPGQMRAQATAIYYLCFSVAGQLIGPTPAGWLASRFGDPKMLGVAMGIQAAVVVLPTLIVLALGRRTVGRAVVRLEESLAHG